MRTETVDVAGDTVTVTPATDDLTRPLPNQDEISERFRHARSSWGISVLLALKNLPHIYQGTVPANDVATRRAKNRVSRKSRRVNRKRSK